MEYKAPETQEELDAIIGARLKREREKYADYEELKAKAAKLDEAEEAKKDALQKANEEIARLKDESSKRAAADPMRSVANELFGKN